MHVVCTFGGIKNAGKAEPRRMSTPSGMFKVWGECYLFVTCSIIFVSVIIFTIICI